MASLVVAVLLVLTGCGSHGRPAPRPGPQPTPGSTTAASAAGPLPAIPWWSRGRLHVDGRVIRSPDSQIVARGGATLLGRAGRSHSAWSLVEGGRLRSVIDTDSAYVWPVVSADGRYAAWSESRPVRRLDRYTTSEAFTVTAYDVGRQRRIATTTMTSRVECCDQGGTINILGVDRDGAVVLNRLGGPSWFWRPGRAPVRVRLPADKPMEGSDQWPGGIAFATSEDGTDPGAFGRVDGRGEVHRVGRVPASAGGVWSPSGTAYAWLPYAPTHRLRPRVWTPHGVRRLRAPRGSPVLMWESPRAVLVVAAGSPGQGPLQLVRCDVTTGACEPAGHRLRHVHLPVTQLF